MPAAAFSNRSVGRSGGTATMPSSTSAKLTLSTRNLRSPSSTLRNGDISAADAYSPSPISPERGSLYSRSKSNFKTDMSYSISSPMSPPGSLPKIPSSTTHAKLHKRKSSSNSVSGATSPLINAASQFPTPFATMDNPFPEVPDSPALSSTAPKIKPYLRKMSSAREDQGMIDLSKSTSENDRLAGLGIRDFAPKSASDVTFVHSSRKAYQHGRTTSTGSQVSNGSSSFAPTPFVHPMAKTPRPYTPPGGASCAGSLNDEEANESEDIVEDEFRLGNGFRTRRSMSISSTPANIPTPLSQSHTASELGLVPKLTTTSQSNVSLASCASESSKQKSKRSRRNIDLSQEYVPPESARTSFDKTFSLRPRRSDSADVLSRDERILAARRKFKEKEANKDRKQEKEAYERRESNAKKEERQRRKSDAQFHQPTKSALKSSSGEKKRRKSSIITVSAGAEDPAVEKFARSYEDYQPSNAASLPTYGTAPGESEKVPRYEYTTRPEHVVEGSWMRFSTWLQTRMLSCGGRD